MGAANPDKGFDPGQMSAEVHYTFDGRWRSLQVPKELKNDDGACRKYIAGCSKLVQNGFGCSSMYSVGAHSTIEHGPCVECGIWGAVKFDARMENKVLLITNLINQH